MILVLHEDVLCLFFQLCFHCKYHMEIQFSEQGALLVTFAACTRLSQFRLSVQTDEIKGKDAVPVKLLRCS